MCGIAGYLGTRFLDDERAGTCLRLMRRRGPDSTGQYRHRSKEGRELLLLHSRLSIIDLNERANQPFRDGSAVLAYNGELYNYLELRDALSREGEQLTTQSDTEVLAKMLQRSGWNGLDQCEGMWAFAYYDQQTSSLMLSRDRFGEKPLYMYRDHDGLYFGSETKFITALLGRRLPINYSHLYRYLVNGYKSLYKVHETFFEGLEELRPAHVLILDAKGREQQHSYWTPQLEQDESITYEQAIAGVRERLIDSVRLRLRSDVPLAFCMSGGVDSNSLISIAKSLFNYDVHGFTIVNEDSRYEEREQIECSVRELNIRHTPVPIITDRFLENLSELVRQHDAPVYTISYYVHWLLMRQIADAGYRISISGTAADELLTGYYDHHNLFLYELRETPLLEPALASWNEHVRPLVRNPYLQNSELYFDDPTIRDHVYLNSAEFAEYLRSPWSEGFSESHYTDSLLRNRMLNELFHEAVPVILHEDDLNAMYYSVENRSPYLDRRLFDFCYRIPSRHLIRDGYAKVILREAMDGIVPRKVLWNHRKVGFNAPIHSFLDVHDAEVRRRLLEPSPIFEHIRRDRIEELLAKPQLPNSESKFLFYFVNSKLFVEEFAS